jgi:threonine/homoserine/homoserine lactone efflux protein
VDLSVFIQGIIIGLTLAAPIGPISLLCIQRTIADGRLHGIISGLGVSTADSFYAVITVLGLTVISSLIIAHQYLFRSIAGIILILIGIRVFMLVPSGLSQKSEHETYLKDYLSMVGIAIANPMTLVFFLVILPGFGVIIQESAFVPAAEFVAGVFFWIRSMVDYPVRICWFSSFPYQWKQPRIDQPDFRSTYLVFWCRNAYPSCCNNLTGGMSSLSCT